MTRETVKDFIKGILLGVVVVAFAIPFVPGGMSAIKDGYDNVALKLSKSPNGATSQHDNSVPDTNTSANTNTSSQNSTTSAPAPAPTTTPDTSYDYGSMPDYSDYSSDYTPSYDYSADFSTPDNSYDYSGYTNVDDNYIPSPNYSGDTIGGYSPTYTCNDGSYSYAQHSQGACSYHGGVAY